MSTVFDTADFGTQLFYAIQVIYFFLTESSKQAVLWEPLALDSSQGILISLWKSLNLSVLQTVTLHLITKCMCSSNNKGDCFKSKTRTDICNRVKSPLLSAPLQVAHALAGYLFLNMHNRHLQCLHFVADSSKQFLWYRHMLATYSETGLGFPRHLA